MLRKKIAFTILSLFSFSALSQASTIKVVNEMKKPFQVKIIPKGDRKAAFIQEVSGDEESSFEVTFRQLNGKITFSIIDNVLTLKPEGKCLNLNVEKDYKVTFRDDKSKITCIAEEIKKK